MLNLSYTFSPKLGVLLENIDRERKKILTTVLPRIRQLELKWRSKLERNYHSLNMSGNNMNKIDMAKLLSSTPEDTKSNLNKEQKESLNYLSAQDYINQEWYMAKEVVNDEVILRLYDIACLSIFGSSKQHFNTKQEYLVQFLDYLEKGDEHPILKAGIAQIQLRLVSPFVNGNGRITRLLSQLYLYKYGYDMKGMLVLDEYWNEHTERYKQEVSVASLDQSITGWLEFYTEAVLTQTEKALLTCRSDRKVTGVSKSHWKLNKRQKQILSILDNPTVAVTNDDVQKKFGVSQITASRDLSKLYKLDLIFRRGKGRSVKYTKI